MKRPLWPDRRRAVLTLCAFAGLALLGAKGCDSNYIGVQDYGTIIGNVVDQAGKPIANAFVRTTGSTVTATTDPRGGFTLVHVAVGEQTVTAYAAGYNAQATADVIVAKEKTASAGNMQLLATMSPQRSLNPTAPPAPAAPASAAPAAPASAGPAPTGT
jgi:muramidase (phage lysozyme)